MTTPTAMTPDDIKKLLAGKPKQAKPWTTGDPLIVLAYGRGGAGKTHLGLTFPGPTVYHDLELNIAETQRHEKFAGRDDIFKYEYSVPTAEHREQAKKYYDQWVEQYFDTMEKFWRAGVQGTHIIDSVTRLWELIRYAIVPMDNNGRVIGTAWNYAPANDIYNAVFKKARDYKQNLYCTCRVKAIWEEQTNEKNPEGKKQRVKTSKVEADWKDPETPHEASMIIELDHRLERKAEGPGLEMVRTYEFKKSNYNDAMKKMGKVTTLDYDTIVAMIEMDEDTLKAMGGN